MTDTNNANNGLVNNLNNVEPEKSAKTTIDSPHGLPRQDETSEVNGESIPGAGGTTGGSTPGQPDPTELNPEQLLSKPDVIDPILGKSQPLPNPEDPPGYAWQMPQESAPLIDTKPIVVQVQPLEDQPTVHHAPPANNAIAVEINLDEKKTPPPGLTDALPSKVDEVDLAATRVTRSALYANRNVAEPVESRQIPRREGIPSNTKVGSSVPSAGKADRSGTGNAATTRAGGSRKPPANGSVKPRYDFGGCFVKVIVLLLFLAVLGAVIAGVFLVFQYFTIAATLPNVDDIQGHASQFETTRFYDRNDELIYEMIDPNAGRRTYTKLENISPYVVAATLAIEDKEFYNHPGFDIFALARAMITNYTSGEVVSGASTITQQLARTLFFTPEERVEVSYRRKAKEIILSSEITRRYSKDEILELYLNEINYGNMAYGIQAAAETYFNKNAKDLTLAESAFLAGLPQAPSVYDIFNNREDTLNRNKQVLIAMYNLSQEKGCIEVSNSPERVCLEAQQAADAYVEMENYEFKQRANPMVYPHWVTYIRYLLEQQYDPQLIYRSGFRVFTTLDPQLQKEADRIVKEQVEALADKNATDGALVALKPDTGEILAMTGSADFYNDAIAGQINMALRPRQPGSSIKPLTYAAAFEKGWTPATILWDVPSEFPPSGDPNDTRDPYKPVNYDGRFHGPMSLRSALANSYNVPAVKALEFIGIYDNPSTPEEDGLIAFARKLGITTLTQNDYGLSLTLGGGEVTLYEMTSAFSVFANGGKKVTPVAITRIEDHSGNVIFELKPQEPVQVMRAEHAYLITSILSDAAARAPMFGTNSILNLSFPAAAKTGTTNEYRDNWTIGYTPDLAVGVWVGNADNTPMVDTSGVSGAAPIWGQFMEAAVPYLTNNSPSDFTRPDGIVEKQVCVYSGTEPSEYCPKTRTEIFSADTLPPKKEDDLWKKLTIDTWTNLKASSACEGFSKEMMVLNVTDKWARKWIEGTDQGKAWLEEINFPEKLVFVPKRECRADDPRPTLLFVGLEDKQTITSDKLDVYAVVNATDKFKDFYLEYGVGKEPDTWKTLVEPGGSPSEDPQKLLTWDMTKVENGTITLRLFMNSTNGGHAEKLLRLKIQVPTRTPTPTKTPKPTKTPTLQPTETPTPGVDPTTESEITPTPTSGGLFPWLPTVFPFFPTDTPMP